MHFRKPILITNIVLCSLIALFFVLTPHAKPTDAADQLKANLYISLNGSDESSTKNAFATEGNKTVTTTVNGIKSSDSITVKWEVAGGFPAYACGIYTASGDSESFALTNNPGTLLQRPGENELPTGSFDASGIISKSKYRLKCYQNEQITLTDTLILDPAAATTTPPSGGTTTTTPPSGGTPTTPDPGQVTPAIPDLEEYDVPIDEVKLDIWAVKDGKTIGKLGTPEEKSDIVFSRNLRKTDELTIKVGIKGPPTTSGLRTCVLLKDQVKDRVLLPLYNDAPQSFVYTIGDYDTEFMVECTMEHGTLYFNDRLKVKVVYPPNKVILQGQYAQYLNGKVNHSQYMDDELKIHPADKVGIKVTMQGKDIDNCTLSDSLHPENNKALEVKSTQTRWLEGVYQQPATITVSCINDYGMTFEDKLEIKPVLVDFEVKDALDSTPIEKAEISCALPGGDTEVKIGETNSSGKLTAALPDTFDRNNGIDCYSRQYDQEDKTTVQKTTLMAAMEMSSISKNPNSIYGKLPPGSVVRVYNTNIFGTQTYRLCGEKKVGKNGFFKVEVDLCRGPNGGGNNFWYRAMTGDLASNIAGISKNSSVGTHKEVEFPLINRKPDRYEFSFTVDGIVDDGKPAKRLDQSRVDIEIKDKDGKIVGRGTASQTIHVSRQSGDALSKPGKAIISYRSRSGEPNYKVNNRMPVEFDDINPNRSLYTWLVPEGRMDSERCIKYTGEKLNSISLQICGPKAIERVNDPKLKALALDVDSFVGTMKQSGHYSGVPNVYFLDRGAMTARSNSETAVGLFESEDVNGSIYGGISLELGYMLNYSGFSSRIAGFDYLHRARTIFEHEWGHYEDWLRGDMRAMWSDGLAFHRILSLVVPRKGIIPGSPQDETYLESTDSGTNCDRHYGMANNNYNRKNNNEHYAEIYMQKLACAENMRKSLNKLQPQWRKDAAWKIVQIVGGFKIPQF